MRPSEIHACDGPLRPKLAKTYPRIGAASSAAAMILSPATGKVVRVNDGAALCPAAPRLAVTLCAEGGVDYGAPLRVTRFEAVGWQRSILHRVRATPAGLHTGNQNVQLFVRQAATGVLGKGRHGGAGHTVRDDLAQHVRADQGQIERIMQRARGSQA